MTLRQNTLGPIKCKGKHCNPEMNTSKWDSLLPGHNHTSLKRKHDCMLWSTTIISLGGILFKCVHLWIPYHIPQMKRAKYYTEALPHICCVSHGSFKKENTHMHQQIFTFPATRSSLSLLTLSRLKVAVDFNNIKQCNGLCTHLRISLNTQQSGTEKYCSKSQRPQ